MRAQIDHRKELPLLSEARHHLFLVNEWSLLLQSTKVIAD